MLPKLIGHRGFPLKYPENTIISFKKALESGADGIELDVHLTKDRKLVVHHYYYLGHTDNGEGHLFKKESVYLRSLDAGRWFGTEFENEKMPFLDEVFDELGDKCYYLVELKAFGKEYADAVLQKAEEKNILSGIQFASYQYPLLSYIKRKNPKSTTGLIAPVIPQWMDDVVAREYIKSHLLLGEIDIVHCPVRLYNRTFVDELHAMGVRCHFGLCDTEEDLKKAIMLGADELTTNNIAFAVNIVKSQNNK